MKRLLCFVLVFCLLGSTAGLFAAAADSPIDEISERISALFEELDLREKMDELDMQTLLADLKALAQESAALDDDQLDAAIRALAEKHGLTLNDEQIGKIAGLCRSLEKGAELKEKAEDAKTKAAGFFARMQLFASKAAAFFQKLSSWLERI